MITYNVIFSIIYGIFSANILIGLLFINNLDKKTRYKEDKSIGLDVKYSLLFLFCNIFCYLFVNKIREKRKINYFRKNINHYLFFEKIGYLTDEEKSKLLKIRRYLKIKNIEYEK